MQASTRRTFLVQGGLGLGAIAYACLRGYVPASADTSKESKMATVRVFKEDGMLSDPITEPKVVKTAAEWKAQLTPEQYKIARAAGTEAAFCGGLLKNHEAGVYTCVCCKLPLFQSSAKFESGTGWPSFFQPICKENVAEKSDESYGMMRTEINCARCDAHLGHVFDDGPRPTGLRFCLNSAAMDFTPLTDVKKLAEKTPATQPMR